MADPINMLERAWREFAGQARGGPWGERAAVILDEVGAALEDVGKAEEFVAQESAAVVLGRSSPEVFLQLTSRAVKTAEARLGERISDALDAARQLRDDAEEEWSEEAQDFLLSGALARAIAAALHFGRMRLEAIQHPATFSRSVTGSSAS